MGHGNVENNMLQTRGEDPLLDSDDERPESFEKGFLQGSETYRTTMRKIRDAMDNQTKVTVQLIDYTKSGGAWVATDHARGH